MSVSLIQLMRVCNVSLHNCQQFEKILAVSGVKFSQCQKIGAKHTRRYKSVRDH